MKPETIALHAGYAGDPATNAATTPIYQTTSFTFNDSQHGADLFNLAVPGNIYSRIMNPTNAVLEQRLAELEGGIGALAVASGMAAIRYSIEAIAEVGCNIVSTSQLYGGTYNLFAHTFPRQGLETRFAVADDLERVKSLIDENTRALFCESIGNPAGNIVDIEAWAKIAHEAGVPLIVDNTVATPLLCRAFDYGADIIVHSLTKYIGGHGTTIGGAIVDSGKFDWAAHPDRFSVMNTPRPLLSRRGVHRGHGRSRLHRTLQSCPAAKHRGGAVTQQCFFDHAGAGDASAAHGAPLSKRPRGGRVFVQSLFGQMG